MCLFTMLCVEKWLTKMFGLLLRRNDFILVDLRLSTIGLMPQTAFHERAELLLVIAQFQRKQRGNQVFHNWGRLDPSMTL